MSSSLYEYFKAHKGEREYKDALARSSEEDKKEYFDSPENLEKKLKLTAD